jgi:hypothetical protein
MWGKYSHIVNQCFDLKPGKYIDIEKEINLDTLHSSLLYKLNRVGAKFSHIFKSRTVNGQMRIWKKHRHEIK